MFPVAASDFHASMTSLYHSTSIAALRLSDFSMQSLNIYGWQSIL
jgi:hypothetical protein